MDQIIAGIISTIVSGCMILISFLIGVLCAMPEDDPESEIQYLKKRISTLEEREHMRMLEEHEIAMMVQKDPVTRTEPAVKEKKPHASPEKKVVQTKWGGEVDGNK